MNRENELDFKNPRRFDKMTSKNDKSPKDPLGRL